MLRVGDWPLGMELGWLNPEKAALLAAGVELKGSILFMVGLLT
jgi:hypothetical protein